MRTLRAPPYIRGTPTRSLEAAPASSSCAEIENSTGGKKLEARGSSCHKEDEDISGFPSGLPEEPGRWDPSHMSDQHSKDRQDLSLHQHGQSAPSTQPMRTIGQRRRESEEKLGSHLREARQKNEQHQAAESEGAVTNVRAEETDSSNLAAIHKR